MFIFSGAPPRARPLLVTTAPPERTRSVDLLDGPTLLFDGPGCARTQQCREVAGPFRAAAATNWSWTRDP